VGRGLTELHLSRQLPRPRFAAATNVGHHRLCFFDCDDPHVFLAALHYEE
jgi:hypothetical protein